MALRPRCLVPFAAAAALLVAVGCGASTTSRDASASLDGGARDVAQPDADSSDAGLDMSADAAGTDAATTDAAASDGGVADAEPPDAAHLDSANFDATVTDDLGQDAGVPCTHWYAAGHGDLYVDYDPEASTLQVSLRSELVPGEGERLYDPAEVCIMVPRSTYDRAVTSGGRPTGAAWDAVGVAASEPFWFLPQTPLAAVPWFGIAPEGVPSATFSANRVEVELVATVIPAGASSASWSTGSFGTPTFVFSTATGITSSLRIAASHDHVNWSFSRAGTYWLTFVARAARASDGALVMSPPVTFRFEVEE